MFSRTVRAIFAFAVLPAVLALLAAPAATVAQGPTRWLTGQLLVASESMADPRFARTVLLMVRHDQDGALGIVINRPLGERPLKELLEVLGMPDAAVIGRIPIFTGGPVQPELGFVVHSSDYGGSGTLDIDGRLAMTSSREIMLDIAKGRGPKQSLIAFGYAGWRAGQLEGEIALGAWVTAPADSALIFEEDRVKVWDIARSRRTRDL
jgi:putative transcriptional regulator